MSRKRAKTKQVEPSAPPGPDDDAVIVPKGQSRLRFYLSFALVIFLLIIFVVPSALMGSLGAGNDQVGETYARWTGPDGTAAEFTYADFVGHKRALRILETSRILPFLGFGQMDPGLDEDVARFLILEQVAADQGIRVTDASLASFILQTWPDPEAYRAFVTNNVRQPAAAFEQALRRALVVRRLKSYLDYGASQPDPVGIERTWKARHQEIAFHIVRIAAADQEAEARTRLAEVDLEAWFGALTESERAPYHTPRRWSAELAYIATGVEAAEGELAGLFEAYPRPEGEDADDLARRYYEAFSHVRFRREEEDETLEGRDRLYLPFETVADACRREAPAYYSMVDWLADLNTRLAEGTILEVVDLATEAAKLGLTFAPPEVERSLEEWRDADEPFAGSLLAAAMNNREAGGLVPTVTVEEGALVVTRVGTVVEPELPPFEELRERASEAWVEQTRGEVALERLEAVRDALGERPEVEGTPFVPTADAAAFEAAATTAGFEVRYRDYQERSVPLTGDDEEADSITEFLRGALALYGAEEGQVPAAELDREGAFAYLVRHSGSRDADLSGMTPAEYESVQRLEMQVAMQSFSAASFDSVDYLKERYQLHLTSWESEESGETTESGRSE
ncbi:MAG: hypothetical protein QF903_09040 [Planctomycetota bacterium]|jgi:hypothetical protein|nr:hypothetical protein [Planctomycetota bacterium]MDP6763438.1 hypothetical protein [Planctomycetota bacterium]MDP6989610.1 hypothetical protein [Planctomycetota bacterium]